MALSELLTRGVPFASMPVLLEHLTTLFSGLCYAEDTALSKTYACPWILLGSADKVEGWESVLAENSYTATQIRKYS